MGGQQNLFDPVPSDRLSVLSHADLLEFAILQQKANEQMFQEVLRLRALKNELEQKTFLFEDRFIVLKNKFFGKSSEKEPGKPDDSRPKVVAPKRRKVQLPSERYPDAPRIERHVEFAEAPDCTLCGTQLEDSGMTENAEYLTVIPKEYIVVQQKRHKYRCKTCHGDLVTAPSPPRIKEGSAYSDEMMIDAAMTKYCDLIPMERYSQMADRSGVPGLPPQSLIECSHYVADFIKPAHDLIKKETLAEKVLQADETPHRMLEGDETSHWHLWGFSSTTASYFEAHDTRSGDVASRILADSDCEFLVSDVFSGYARAVREANEIRVGNHKPSIQNIYCNAHSRRRFKEAQDHFPEPAKFFIDSYKEIYRLEGEATDKPADQVLQLRSQMRPLFDAMKAKCIELLPMYPTKSSVGKAFGYLLRNFNELTEFIANPLLPIDNNRQERLLRNPVIGRKTWYGTHSRRGAETMAILFSVVETCKLNNVNPREYLTRLICDLHQGKNPYTPATFKSL